MEWCCFYADCYFWYSFVFPTCNNSLRFECYHARVSDAHAYYVLFPVTHDLRDGLAFTKWTRMLSALVPELQKRTVWLMSLYVLILLSSTPHASAEKPCIDKWHKLPRNTEDHDWHRVLMNSPSLIIQGLFLWKWRLAKQCFAFYKVFSYHYAHCSSPVNV